MPTRTWAYFLALVMACSDPTAQPEVGRVVVALTVDWEGAYISPEGLDALDEVRKDFGAAPLTHFISAAYFTKAEPDPAVVASITSAVREGDELALHLHAWRSLAKASGVEPKVSPSFLSGTDQLMPFEDGDLGFDTDLDVYDVPELRRLVQTSQRLLEPARPVSKTFRAGGYLGTPKVLQAILDEGYAVDSSAIDHRQLDKRNALPARLEAIWPGIEPTSQPFLVDVPGGQLLEMPISAVADYVTAAEISRIFDAAHARLREAPDRDVFVVLALHQETLTDLGGRLGEAMQQVRARHDLVASVLFTTVEEAARLAREPLPRN